MAGTTGLEPAASAVTGQRSNQLNYVPTRQINEMRNRQCLCGFARFAYRAPIAFGCLRERLPGATVYNPPANFCAELFGAGNARASRHGAKQGGTSLNHSNSFPSNAKGFDVSSHSDDTGYATANTPATIRDPDRWQPLDADRNGKSLTQVFYMPLSDDSVTAVPCDWRTASQTDPAANLAFRTFPNHTYSK